MAEPNPEHPSGNRSLSRLIFDEVNRALRGYGLPAADRDDVALNAVQTAFDRWDTYREDAGSLRQWIGGIVRNEVRLFLRTRRRQAQHDADFAFLMPTCESKTPEGEVSARDLFDYLITQVPIEQRRVLYLMKFADHTLREAAAREGISPATAHARYRDGLKAFEAAAERWKEEQKSHGVAPMPFTVAELFAAGRPPPGPDDDFERVWTRMASKLGITDADPPESGPRRTDQIDADPPSSRPPDTDPAWLRDRKLALLRKVGIFLGVLGVGLAGGAGLSRCGDEHAHAAPSHADALPAGAAGPGGAPGEPILDAVPEPPPAAPAPPPPPPPATARPSQTRPADPLGDEMALVDRGRTALEGGHPAKALAAFAEHARRFPRGQAADARRRLWNEACAQLRDRAPHGGPTLARCAQQP